MQQRIVLLTISLVTLLNICIAQPSLTDPGMIYIEEGTQWEVEVTPRYLDLEPYIVYQRLEGYREIAGKKYIQLWTGEDEENLSLASYIWIPRGTGVENEYIYTLPLDSENPEDEKLVCHMSWIYEKRPEEHYSLSIMGKISEEPYQVTSERAGTVDIGVVGWVRTYNPTVVGCEDLQQEGVVWTHGLGSNTGFTNQLGIDPQATTKVLNITSPYYGHIWPRPQNSVGNVSSDAETNGVKYSIDGTIFPEGAKGIYIQDGKKYIAR